MTTKRRQWLPESMECACKAVIENGMGLREAARAYNVPVETLRRCVAGIVHIDCVRRKNLVQLTIVSLWQTWGLD